MGSATRGSGTNPPPQLRHWLDLFTRSHYVARTWLQTAWSGEENWNTWFTCKRRVVRNNAGVRYGADIIHRLYKCFAPLHFVTRRGTAVRLLVSVPGYCPLQTETIQSISWQQHDVFAFEGRPYLQQSNRDGTFCIKYTSSRITREFWYRMFFIQDKSLTDIVRYVKLFRSRYSVVPGVRFPGSATYFVLS